MNKFLFKSTEADFQKLYLNKLDILMKNMLYTTHQLDKVLLIVRHLETSAGLQKQVDEFFEDSSQEEDKEPD